MLTRYRYLLFLLGLLFTAVFAQFIMNSPAQAQTVNFNCANVIEIPLAECEALVALYHTTDGGIGNWLTTNTPCRWSGIGCLDGHVDSMFLRVGRIGGLPPEIGDLSQLRSLDLGTNEITTIPAEIGNLSQLLLLDLRGNQITTIPAEIGSLSNLRTLNLGGNQIAAVPAEIGQLTNLNGLYLSDNLLTEIPNTIASLPLSVLHLSDNYLTVFPPEITGLNLRELTIGGNQISVIPADIGNLTNLTHLVLVGMPLAELPAEMGNLSNLVWLGLSDNQLTTFPAWIPDLTNLSALYIGNNPLNGPLPTFLTALNLRTFSFPGSGLCAPDDPLFADWLAGVSELEGTGHVCGQPTAALTGVILNEQGEPIADASVSLYRSIYGGPAGRRFLTHGLTDSMGRYNFDNLGEGIDYILYAQDGARVLSPQYYDNKTTIETADLITLTLGLTRTANMQLSLPPAPLIEVTAVGAQVTTNSDPVSGQLYISMPQDEPSPLTISYSAVCDNEQPPTEVVLNYNRQQYPMTNNGGQYQTVIPAEALTLFSSVSIKRVCAEGNTETGVGAIMLYVPSGVVTDRLTNQPIAGAKLTLYSVSGWSPRKSATDPYPNRCESNRSRAVDQPWLEPAPTELGVPPARFTTLPNVAQQQTNSHGQFGWSLGTGCWYIVAEAEGYHPLVSPMFGSRTNRPFIWLADPLVDVNLALRLLDSRAVYLPMIQN